MLRDILPKTEETELEMSQLALIWTAVFGFQYLDISSWT
jgi:hypothetical protein